VTVTNQADKDGQLPKIKTLGETVRAAFAAVEGWQEKKVFVVTEELTRAKVALKAWESENHATAGVGHPLKAAVEAAEREQAAARQVKERHEQALALSVMPCVMERDEGRRMVEEQRKKEAAAKEAKEAEARRGREAKEAEARREREAKELKFKQWEGPHKECCVELAPLCCVSEDGKTIYGCGVPTKYYYILPCCLHMPLCPQQGCDPMCEGGACIVHCLANTCICFQDTRARFLLSEDLSLYPPQDSNPQSPPPPRACGASPALPIPILAPRQRR
jgi:hypothetical protein